MPVTHVQFTTAGMHTWVCPVNVYGAIVECLGTGGDASSAHGGGGGARAAGWLDTVPGTSYNVFIAPKTGTPAVTYFKTPTTIYAARGEAATGSAPGLGGKIRDSLGTIVYPGSAGDRGGFGVGQGGQAGGTFYTDPFGSAHYGQGGFAPGGVGVFGAVQISWRVGAAAGCGGGGGGGYASSVLTVTPGDLYVVHLGIGGLGQQEKTPDPVFSYIPLTHGFPTWFGSEDLVKAAGGDSAGGVPLNSFEPLIVGGLGGGQPGAHDVNVGDVTFPGGNGGAGNGISKIFAFNGGGGGGVAGPRGPGGNGGDGHDGGGGGFSANDFNFALGGISPRSGTGGIGVNDPQHGHFDIDFGTYPGGGSAGDALTAFYRFGYNFPIPGRTGRVLVSGIKTGKKLLPEF